MPTLRVRPEINCVVTIADGSQVHLSADRAFDPKDPILREIEKATGEPVSKFLTADGDATPGRVRRSVEQATAAPGELR